MSTLVENRLVLRLSDRSDFGAVGIPVKLVPDTLVDGRALTPDPVVELQVAVLADDISGAGQNAALREIAARHADRDGAAPRHLRPFRLEEMPSVAPLDERWSAPPCARRASGSPRGGCPWVWVATISTRSGLDLSGSAVAVLAGPPKSGRTNLLRFAAAGCARPGCRCWRCAR